MPIYVQQKFQRCDNCGRMIPLRMKPLIMEASNKKLFFCSEWCVQYYKNAHHLSNPFAARSHKTTVS